MSSDVLPGMPSARPRTLVIPYGIAALPAGRMADWAPCHTLPFPCETIDTGSGRALKLNNGRFHIEASAASEAAASAEPFDTVRQHLAGLCGTWSGLPRRFLDYYLGEVEAIVEDARDELERRLLPYEGLFSYKDWRYSAPKPLPRAFLQVPDSETEAFVQVEFAFWLGDRLLAVQSEPEPLTPRAAARRRERLAHAGIELIGYGASDVVPGERRLVGRILGDHGAAFWSGETLPAGPFRPDVPIPA